MEPRFERLETGFFAPSKNGLTPLRSMRILSWNINRGQQLDAVIEFLRDAKADVILLQESDVNARLFMAKPLFRDGRFPHRASLDFVGNQAFGGPAGSFP